MTEFNFDRIILFSILAFILGVVIIPLLYCTILYVKFKINILKTLRKTILQIGLFAIIFAGIISVITVLIYTSTTPAIMSSSPGNGEEWESFKKPITVNFNIPVDTARIDPHLTPDIKGKWVWQSYLGIPGITKTGRFYPDETLFPGQRVVLYIIGVGRINNPENHELAINFDAPRVSEVVDSYPADQSTTVQRDDLIRINLSKSNDFNSEWLVNFDPAFEYETFDQFKKELVIKPKNNLDQQKTYKLKIQRRPIRYDLVEGKILEYAEFDYTKDITFTTVKEPNIEDFSPKNSGVREETVIKVKFALPMDRESVEKNFITEPMIEGAFSWGDDQNMTYTPTTKFPKETKYKVTFKEGTKSVDQGVFAKDIIYEFETIGPVKVSTFVPSPNQQRVAEYSSIGVTFDQEVDHASAQSLFTINPGVSGVFSWNGNTMIFDPSTNLGFNATYTIKILTGVKTVYGVDSKQEFSSKFTVRPDEVLIGGVPQIYQPYGSFSCNIYSAIMALSWKGHKASASQLISEIGYNSAQTGGHWAGNPYKQYVGNSDGSWGYGVYWTALQKVFNNRGVTTEIKTNWNTREMAQAINNGRIVVIWRYNGESSNFNKSWTASDGTFVYAINGQHGSVVTGFKGSINNPTQFLLNDPWYGKGWYNTGYLDSVWARMNRSALIVH